MRVSAEMAAACMPDIWFDAREPFFPRAVGYTFFESPATSASFPREIDPGPEAAAVIEYAIYWDFDIQHLYELEHLWVWVSAGGSVLRCEGSWHGGYGVLWEQGESPARVYSQPGKHAFSPDPERFGKDTGGPLATDELAGNMGLHVTPLFQGILATSPWWNARVEAWLKGFRFRPSFEFRPFRCPEAMFMPWEALQEKIPVWVTCKLADILREGIQPE